MNFRIPNKQPKPVVGPCGHKFVKEGIKPFHPYCSPQCFLKFNTGKVEFENLKDLKLSVLMDIAKGVFCDYIKLRDKDQPEITSGEMEKKSDKMNAGHLFDCEKHPGLIFHEDNCFKQSEFYNLQMNDKEIWDKTFNNVALRIGTKKAELLKTLSDSVFIRNYKYSRLELIDYIEKFTKKSEELKK